MDDRLGVVVFNLKGIYHHEVAKILADRRGIAVRHGWFCAHPYCRRLMNLTEEEASKFIYDKKEKMKGMVRVSLGPYNTIEEIDILLDELKIYLMKYYKKRDLQCKSLLLGSYLYCESFKLW